MSIYNVQLDGSVGFSVMLHLFLMFVRMVSLEKYMMLELLNQV